MQETLELTVSLSYGWVFRPRGSDGRPCAMLDRETETVIHLCGNA